MGKLETFRKVMAMPEVLQSIELTEKLKDLYESYFELLEKNNELHEKLKGIENINDIKKNAKISSGFYTLDDIKDVNGEDVVFCLNCLYEHNLQIPMNFGIVERGLQDAFSKRIISKSVYGYSCNKCGTNLAVLNNETKN